VCGLVGFSGPEPFNKQNIDTLMYINSLERGLDATGIYSNLNELQKDIIPGWKFITESVDLVPDTMFMGHVRSKTVGVNSIINAHPFKRDNCILIHNGTLKNHWDLLKKYDLKIEDYSVDSDIITLCLNKSVYFSVLSEIEGSAALIFHDIRIKNRLYVFKNKERPLFRGHIGPNMYISSLEESLELINCINIKEFDNDKLYTLEDGLFIGEALNIASIPYKHVYPKTPDTIKFNDYESRKLIGCNVRMKHNGEVKTSNNATYKYFKHTYCKIMNVLDENTFTVLLPTMNLSITIDKSLLIMTDVIKATDYAIAMLDLNYAGQPADADKAYIEISKGDIIEVIQSFPDGTFSSFVTNRINNSINKQYFQKVYPNDNRLKKYLKNNDLEKSPFNLNNAINNTNIQNVMQFPAIKDQSPINIVGYIEPNYRLSDSLEEVESTLAEYFEEFSGIMLDLTESLSTLDLSSAEYCTIALEELNNNLQLHLYTLDNAKSRNNRGFVFGSAAAYSK